MSVIDYIIMGPPLQNIDSDSFINIHANSLIVRRLLFAAVTLGNH